jgi:hypothetical protein
MIYQIFHDEKTSQYVKPIENIVTPFGVHKAKDLPRPAGYLYDDVKKLNLTSYNSLSEWRVLYYIWQHHPSSWVGFTSWAHKKKGFSPNNLEDLCPEKIEKVIKTKQIIGFACHSIKELHNFLGSTTPPFTLKTQFLLCSKITNDKYKIPLGVFHDQKYWDFVMQEYKKLYSLDLEKALPWEELGQISSLNTWCNAFLATWPYFDKYMQTFSPIVLNGIKHFKPEGSDRGLGYICERLIIIFNYLVYTGHIKIIDIPL